MRPKQIVTIAVLKRLAHTARTKTERPVAIKSNMKRNSIRDGTANGCTLAVINPPWSLLLELCAARTGTAADGQHQDKRIDAARRQDLRREAELADTLILPCVEQTHSLRYRRLDLGDLCGIVADTPIYEALREHENRGEEESLSGILQQSRGTAFVIDVRVELGDPAEYIHDEGQLRGSTRQQLGTNTRRHPADDDETDRELPKRRAFKGSPRQTRVAARVHHCDEEGVVRERQARYHHARVVEHDQESPENRPNAQLVDNLVRVVLVEDRVCHKLLLEICDVGCGEQNHPSARNED